MGRRVNEREGEFYNNLIIEEKIKNFNINKFLFSLTISLFFTIFFINFIPNISADIVSVNSGGSEQIIVNPDIYIEGFYSGGFCGDGIIDIALGEQCDNGAANGACAATCSTSCTTNSCEVTPPGGGPGGGGGGGGGGAAITQNLAISPNVFDVTLAVNTNLQQTITVTNLGGYTTTVTVSKSMFDENANPIDMIILDATSFTLNAGESRDIGVIFVALNDTGIFTGNIRVGNVDIPVTINVKTKLLLFDSNIVVLNKDYIVVKGDDLKTRVTLIPIGEKERLDVTLDYTIRDYSGKVYLTQKETMLIEKKINFDRNFGTGSLPIGRYVVGLQLKYPNGVAPSSAHFEVVTRTPVTFGQIVLWLIILIIIIAIIIIIIIVYKRRKKEQENE